MITEYPKLTDITFPISNPGNSYNDLPRKKKKKAKKEAKRVILKALKLIIKITYQTFVLKNKMAKATYAMYMFVDALKPFEERGFPITRCDRLIELKP